MPRAAKKCGRENCEERVVAKRYCPTHTAEKQQRPQRQTRGYDAKHDQAKAMWAPRVAAGGVTCWRCSLPILPTDEWQLGHGPDRTWSLPEHTRTCNLRAAGLKSHGKGWGTPTP